MAGYEVRFTDFTNKGAITVDDGATNSSETSITLIGRNYNDFGELLNTNLLQMLENFASATSPSNPVEGQLWYDNTTGVDQLKVYDGSQWVSASGLKKAASEPQASASTIGDIWVDTANSQVYVYTGSGYILVGPDYSEGASTGSRFEEVINSTNTTENVIIDRVNNVPVSITAQTEFSLKKAETGFSVATVLKKGITLASDAKLYGTATSAENLVISNTNIAASTFARKDVTNNFSKAQNIIDNTGLAIGENGLLRLSITGSTAQIRHTATDGNLDFKINDAGTVKTAIRVTPDRKIGIANEAPQEALDVTGNAVVSGNVNINGGLGSTSFSTGSLVVSGGVGISQNMYLGGDLDVAENIVAKNLTPKTNLSYNLGTSTLQYNTVYANNFVGNLTGTVTGNISGTSASAGKLASPTTFRMSGHVTAPEFTFDGSGTSIKEFVTTVSDAFITGQTLSTTIEGTDEILIARGTDIRRVKQSVLVGTVPTFFLGMIMPYAGETLPVDQTDWVLCHGQELVKANYISLYSLIGDLYGVPSSTLYFKVPDLRGRHVLGYVPNDVSYTDTNRIYDKASPSDTWGSTSVLGTTSGREEDWITKDNLPNHEHSLEGDASNQYLALTNAGDGSDTGATANNLVGNTAGYGIDKTGGVDGVSFTTQNIDNINQEVGEKFSVTSPSVVMNYIMYIGPST